MAHVISVRSIVVLCVALLPGIRAAQSGAGGSSKVIRITGRVVDPINMALPRTTVSLTAVGSQTAETVLTGDDGAFAFNSVSPGAYLLRFMRRDSFLAKCL
jgi:hypothetical protein